MTIKSCWIVLQDAAGMLSQARGLAEAMGFENAPVHYITLKFPWSVLPVDPLLASAAAFTVTGPTPMTPPWPDLVISCGRKGAMASLGIKKMSGGHTRLVHIQNPRGRRAGFDVLVIPRHDRVQGANVISSDGALHAVTQDKIQIGIKLLPEYLKQDYPKPWIVGLLGGPTKSHRMDAAWAYQIAPQLIEMTKESGGSLMLTPSRRTPPDVIMALTQSLTGIPSWIWSGVGQNPYFGLLGQADVLLVTEDSVSMLSEACSTQKPVMVLALPLRRMGGRLQSFVQDLFGRGLARPFSGRYEVWKPQPFTDMQGIARRVWDMLGETGGRGSGLSN